TASYLMQHPEVLAEAAKKMYHNFNEGTPEEKASMLGAAASVLVPGLSVTKGTKVGKVADGVQDFATKAMEGVKDLNKVLQNSGHLAELPKFKPFLSTPEGVPFSVGKIPMDSNPLPKTFVQEHYINEMNGFGDVKGGKIEGTGKGKASAVILGNGKSLDDMANMYADNVKSNKKWSWLKSVPDGDKLSIKEKKAIKDAAISQGLIPKVNVTKVEGMKFGFADFKGAGVVHESVELPDKLWKASDAEQFKWLDEMIGGNRPGMTWHHTEIPGKMELVETGIHDIVPHNGGRTTGMWADAPR
ncbi:HNH endonuclease signature motif containing protein, partial [Paenibacillus odorifer]